MGSGSPYHVLLFLCQLANTTGLFLKFHISIFIHSQYKLVYWYKIRNKNPEMLNIVHLVHVYDQLRNPQQQSMVRNEEEKHTKGC